jgi:hypothetical protein
MNKRTKKGETARLIYKLLHRNPDMTTPEIAAQLPHLTPSGVQTMVSRMHLRGELESRGKKTTISPSGKRYTYSTYHVKYRTRSAPKYEPKLRPKPKTKPAPVNLQKFIDDWIEEPTAPPVEAPKPVTNLTQITPEPEGPTTPIAEREVLIMRHLTDIYRAMNLMTDQQEALIDVLKGTLIDLAETKQELEEAQKARGFWGTIKGWFA